MREIKFRAWDDENSEFCSVSNYGWNFVFDKSEDSLKNGHYHYILENGYYPEVILMQYTGLKDKNGVEIYEGDIVHIDMYNEISICELDKKGFWKLQRDGSYDYVSDYEHFQIKVIGNIYENPELLESNNEN